MPAAVTTPSFFLTFGMVVIAVKSHPAARTESIEFEQLHGECGTKLQVERRCGTCNKIVAKDDIVKGYALGQDQYIRVTQQELDELHPEKTKSMEVKSFFPFEQLDPVYFKGTNYLGPADRASAKAFHLLRTVMQRTSKAALVQYVYYGRERIGVIRALPNGVLMLHECFYPDQVRSFESQDKIQVQSIELKKQEQELALMLVEKQSIKRVDLTNYHDNYRERLDALLESKVTNAPVPKFEARPIPAQVPDLIEALKKSLAAREKVEKKPERVKVKR